MNLFIISDYGFLAVTCLAVAAHFCGWLDKTRDRQFVLAMIALLIPGTIGLLTSPWQAVYECFFVAMAGAIVGVKLNPFKRRPALHDGFGWSVMLLALVGDLALRPAWDELLACSAQGHAGEFCISHAR